MGAFPVRNKAVARVWSAISRRVQIALEMVMGLDFSAVIHPGKLGFDDAVVFRGSPSGNQFLLNILADLEIGSSDSILDIGCSKGSAIRCMLKYPFGRVDGIEISQKLSEIANGNFSKLKKLNVRIFNMDAREFDQYDNYNLFYLYNPFPDFIMADVVAELARQVADKEAIIIYNNPTCHQMVEAAGFRKMLEYPDQWGNGIFVYANVRGGDRLSNCLKA